MESARQQRYLETLLQGRAPSSLRELVPLVNRWNEILSSVPGLHKRHPGAHSRIAELKQGLLTIEADHPAWLQLLQWHEGSIVERLKAVFPQLAVRAIQFRLSRPGHEVERPNVVMPEPVKPSLSVAELAERDGILAELEELIRKKSLPPEKSD